MGRVDRKGHWPDIWVVFHGNKATLRAIVTSLHHALKWRTWVCAKWHDEQAHSKTYPEVREGGSGRETGS